MDEKKFKTIVAESAEALKRGGIIILPTETVYGIAADARNKSAVERIYNLKNRGLHKPFQVLFQNIKQAEEYVILHEKARELAEKYLPGPLTIIVEEEEDCGLAKNINILDHSIGVRIPDHEFFNQLMGQINFPLACTSANLSGEEAAKDFAEISSKLIEKVDYAADLGACKSGKPSTVVDARDNHLKILRQGEIKI
jgi:L-threonylcarbamoyladenylate synthase